VARRGTSRSRRSIVYEKKRSYSIRPSESLSLSLSASESSLTSFCCRTRCVAAAAAEPSVRCAFTVALVILTAVVRSRFRVVMIFARSRRSRSSSAVPLHFSGSEY
jgi:hypothetical protein